MKTPSQFLTVLKKEIFASPQQWMLFLAFLYLVGFDVYFNRLGINFLYDSIGGMLPFFIVLVGCSLLTPGLWGGTKWPADDRELMLTRAIERSTYFRVKSAIYFAAILIPLAVILGMALYHPKGVIEYVDSNKMIVGISQEKFLELFPGSLLEPMESNGHANQMVVPNGKLLLAEWKIWKAVVMLVFAQGVLIWLAKKNPRQEILWVFVGLYMLWVFAPGISYEESQFMNEQAFLFFIAHKISLFIGLLVLGVILQPWCERRFKTIEVL